MTIERWEIWLADLDPTFGTEAGKRRPVLVLQSDLLNKHHFSTAILPISTNVSHGVSILRYNLDSLNHETGLKKSSDLLIDQIRTIDNKRFVKKLGAITDFLAQNKISEQLMIVLDLR